MSDELPDSPPVPEPQPLHPDEALRNRLGTAYWAALISGVLGALSLAADQFGQPLAGTVLAFLTIVPQAGVLVAFVAVAKALADDGLQRAAIGHFVGFWLLVPLLLIDPAIVPEEKALWVVIPVAVGYVLLLGYLFQGGFVVVLGVWLTVRFAVRGLRRKGIAELVLPVAVALVAAGTLIGATIWFGTRLIRQRPRLNEFAGYLGWLMLLELLVALGLIAWGVAKVVLLFDGKEPDDATVEAAVVPVGQAMMAVGMLFTIALAAATALLFSRLRQAGADDSGV